MHENTILDQAEQRLGPAKAKAQHVKDELIEAMRQEISYAHYAQAKLKMPEVERAINTVYRPFLNRVDGLQAKSRAQLPALYLGYLRAMDALCRNTAAAILRGLETWDHLQPPLWKDGRTIDQNSRSGVIDSVRRDLRAWDGAISLLAQHKATIEDFIQQTGWPTAQSGPGGASATAIPRKAEAPRVETDFSLEQKS